ncbi:MAG: hypothetical protein J6C93_02285, partial [Clostridia bacterium]|nr:hypothetical protein [Clostridia bacterium]
MTSNAICAKIELYFSNEHKKAVKCNTCVKAILFDVGRNSKAKAEASHATVARSFPKKAKSVPPKNDETLGMGGAMRKLSGIARRKPKRHTQPLRVPFPKKQKAFHQKMMKRLAWVVRCVSEAE